MAGGSRLTRALALVGVILVVYNFAYNLPVKKPERVLRPATKPAAMVRPPVLEDLPHEVPPQHENPPQQDPPQVDPPQDDLPQEDLQQKDWPPGGIAVTPRRTHRADVGACAPRQVLSRSVQQDHGLDVPHRPLNWLVPPHTQWPPASCSPRALCVELGRAAGADRQVLLVVADAASAGQLDRFVASAQAAGVGGQLPCFRAGEKAVDDMRQRYRPEMTQQQFSRFAASLIDGSLDNWRTGAYDCYQRCCLGIL